MCWRARTFAFLRNDLEYAPFGIGVLRGLTPARLAIAALFSFSLVLVMMQNTFASIGFNERVFKGMMRLWAGVFVAAVPMMLFIVWADRWSSSAPWRRRVASFVVATLAGAAACAAIHVIGLPLLFGATLVAWSVPLLPVRFYQATLTGALLSAVLFFAAREREAGKQLLAARLARVATERQIAEARLQLLKAQIEPHFLFNSLASVKRLCENDVAGGRHLLRNMGIYLRTAMARRQGDQATLGEQMEMTQSYLEIFKQRMGERLNLCIDLPAELRLAMVPSLMLVTLAENAVKHGIGPRGAGGSITITATRAGDVLLVEVADDGVGFKSEAGTGVGLANTRARMQSLYGESAELDLRNNSGDGVTAAIRMPLVFATPQARTPVADSMSPSDVAEASVRDTFWGRFWRILSRKHWGWALFLGVAVAALDRLRGWAAASNIFGIVWIEETIVWTIAAILFMLAIVVVEASQPRSRVSLAWRHFLGWGVAAGIFGWIVWVYPAWVDLHFFTAPANNPHTAAMMKKQMANPQFNVRTMHLFGTGGVVIVHGALGTLLYVWLRNAKRAAEALSKAELERADAERKLITSRLEALEAEVDPAFMFSTLETIENTYDHDRAAADAMLDELTAFLRAAIPRLRSEEAVASK